MNHQAILEAVEALKRGGFALVVDDLDRENEGDLFLAAQFATPEKLSFLLKYTTGIVCVAMEGERLDRLELPLMVSKNSDPRRTAFTVSVDYLPRTTTGVSAADRSATIRALADREAKPAEFGRPGHVFPLRYREGGVLKRAGHTEAIVDLLKLAGLEPVGALCEVVNPDGSMARRAELIEFAKEHRLPLLSVAELIRYRRRTEKLVERVSQARLPTPYGEFTAYVYRSKLDGIEHMALVKGEAGSRPEVLVRIHSECLTGDVFGSKRCDCGSQLQLALEKIAEEGAGILVYLRGHEGRGIGLGHKLRAYTLQDQGRDTVDANLELGLPVDSREYGIGAQILTDLKVSTFRLLTNNPAKYGGLEGYDLTMTERVPLVSKPCEENQGYLQTKQLKLGHLLELSSEGAP